MIKVKICGIRDREDIASLNDWLPDYAGFVFAESRRRVAPAEAVRLVRRLDERIQAVGVFVNRPPDETAGIAAACGLSAVQLHGDEPPEAVEQLRLLLKPEVEIWKAVRVRDRDTVEAAMRRYPADRFLLDAYIEGSYGGAGKTFDWGIASEAAEWGSILLAGGLTPLNADQAARQVRPYAVDVSSGVETGGKKDGSKIRDFIYAIRSMKGREDETHG